MKDVECALCGARESRIVYSGRDNRHGFDEQVYHVVRCRACGLVYLNPRPEESDMPRIYHQEYYRPETDASAHLASQPLSAKAGYVSGPPGKILDVGCGKGDFLHHMKNLGWTVTGVEFSPDCPNPYGLDIRRGDLMHAGLADATFDAITFWSSLEHMIHPNEVVREAVRVLKPGGQWVVHVPNFDSISQRWMRGEDIPRHVIMFTPGTLRAFLEKHGIRVRRVVQRNDICSGGCREAVVFLAKRMMGRTWDEVLTDHHNPSRVPKCTLLWTVVKILDRLVTIPLTEIMRLAGHNGAMTVQGVRS